MPGNGVPITPQAGRSSICVYNKAYPNVTEYPDGATPQMMVPLDYSLTAGQVYVTSNEVAADYLANRDLVVHGSLAYYQIFYNHRIAFVRSDDVSIVPS